MNADELKKILADHALWLDRKGGERANLTDANLTDANLTDANLTGANLTRANLTRANLTDAYLTGANLTDANLARANLTGAYLTRANLTRANLPSPVMVLLAYWDNLSKPLTRDLMRYDAANHPDPSAFDRWADGGTCPYANLKIQRVANFAGHQELWVKSSKARVKSAYELMVAVIREKCADSDYHKKATK